MVVFVDYETDAFHDHHLSGDRAGLSGKPILLSKLMIAASDIPSRTEKPGPSAQEPNIEHADRHDEWSSPSATADESEEGRTNPNCNSFSAALSCYPVVKEIARSVDLNTLHALSRTCRQFRANLMPFRHQLIKQTLRCENEYIETVSDMLDDGAAIPNSLKSVLRLLSRSATEPGRLTSGKVGKCARDMVSECRRCSRAVCRNCTIKPPTGTQLKGRVRRLCTTCRTAPIASHLSPHPSTAVLLPGPASHEAPQNSTALAFLRTPCLCEDVVWLCYSCGQTLRSYDTTYRRVWTWRTRYSTYLGGGLGTGIGEGCQGVKCGRGEDCLAAQEIELEVDCEVDEWSTASLSDVGQHHHPNHHAHRVFSHNSSNSNSNNQDTISATSGAELLDVEWSDSRDEEEPGYFRQEIVGIGGVVKHKVKKRVTVGACVEEYEDERETGRYLTREEDGRNRSWCGWCWRVVPAKGELWAQ